MKTPIAVSTGFSNGKAIGSKITELPGAAAFGLGYSVGFIPGLATGVTTAIVGPVVKKFKEGFAHARQAATAPAVPAEPVVVTPSGEPAAAAAI